MTNRDFCITCGVTSFIFFLVRPSIPALWYGSGGEGHFDLGWTQDGEFEEFIVYWKTENGPEYNTSSQTDYNVHDDEIIYRLRDDRITSGTWYYVSLVAVAGEETSSRSNTEPILTGEFMQTNYIIWTNFSLCFCLTYM